MKIIYLVLKRLLDEIQQIPEEDFTPLKIQTIILKYMNNQAR